MSSVETSNFDQRDFSRLHGDCVLEGLQALRKNKILCDLVLIAQGTAILEESILFKLNQTFIFT